ncbi:MAG: hypothetical protein R3247_16155 [Rhodothermales bacterium]|nr:hypothetical protein [Rhodothermales bacterium]
MRGRTNALCVALLMLFGCDGLGGEAACPGALTAEAEPAEAVLFLAEEPLQIRPDSLGIRHTLGLPLAFTARSSDPGVALVRRGADTTSFEVAPVAAGTARIEIEAGDACGLTRTVALPVRVADPCRAEADPAFAVFFPVEPGRTWTFDYHRHKGPDFTSPEIEYRASLVWEVVSASACGSGRRFFQIRETFTGTVTYRPGGEDVVSDWQLTRLTDARLDGRRLVIDGYTATVPGAAWIAPATAPDTLAVAAGQGRIPETYGVQQWTVRLARGAGITHWHYQYHGKRGERDVITLRLR